MSDSSPSEPTTDDVDLAAAFEQVFGRPLSQPEPDRRSSRDIEREDREVERYITRQEDPPH